MCGYRPADGRAQCSGAGDAAFSHLEKITERLDEKHYRLQLMYNKSDETEMVIRILSFGPLLRVQEAAGFIELLRHRLRKQLALRAKE